MTGEKSTICILVTASLRGGREEGSGSKPLSNSYFDGYFNSTPSGRYNYMRFSNEFWGSIKMEVGLSAGVGGDVRFMGQKFKAKASLAEASLGNMDNAENLESEVKVFVAETDLTKNVNAGVQFAGFKTTLNGNEPIYTAEIGKVEGKVLINAMELNHSRTLFKLQNVEGEEFKVMSGESKPKINIPDKTIGVGFTFGIKVSVGLDFEKMKKSFNHFYRWVI